MAIRKQEFYEGAAIHRLVKAGKLGSILYEPPFFVLNEHVRVLLKYSTRSRSPWGFNFSADELDALTNLPPIDRAFVGLICASDGIAAITVRDLLTLTHRHKQQIHVSCYRDHREHYEMRGPYGPLAEKVAPSRWETLLKDASNA